MKDPLFIIFEEEVATAKQEDLKSALLTLAKDAIKLQERYDALLEENELLRAQQCH